MLLKPRNKLFFPVQKNCSRKAGRAEGLLRQTRNHAANHGDLPHPLNTHNVYYVKLRNLQYYVNVLMEKDIVACNDGQVVFRYRNARTGKMERQTVPGAQFLWLVLQHVLPKGFRRARNFGFLHSNCKRLIALLQVVLKFNPGRASDWIKERAPILCTCCGAVMKIVRTRIRSSFSGGMSAPLAARGAC